MRIAPGAAGGDDHAMLLTCQSGYEIFLARELEDAGATVAERGPGWVRADSGDGSLKVKVEGVRLDDPLPMERPGAPGGRALPDLAFAHLTLLAPVEVRGESVNALAQGVAEFFLGSLRGERVESAWPCVWRGPQETVGLGRRMSAVEAAFGELLTKKLRRVAKLATGDLPRGVGPVRGLLVYFTDFGRMFVARDGWAHGQRRMADDDFAPSRSYLKIEEAYGVLGTEPQAGEVVVDLGAAPGGWSYSAAKRGARVIAVDNGPLKGGALNHPLIEHRLEDAFRFQPSLVERDGGTPSTSAGTVAVDWLFCDVVEEPHHVLQNLVSPWLEHGWCRRFVVNLKFGRADPAAFLRELRAPDAVFSRHAADYCVRHLYHDREEFTVVGTARSGGQ